MREPIHRTARRHCSLRPALPWLGSLLFIAVARAGAAEVAEAERGVYAIWVQPATEHVRRLPYVRGEQVVAQWADVEPEEGRYDFGPVERQLAAFHRTGRKATVQINGNYKPDYLYRRIAVHPDRLSPQVQDGRGTLQFWDPLYLEHYLRLIAAYGRYLAASPLRAAVAGVRLNFNPMGTEHYFQEIGSEKFKPTEAGKDWRNYRPAPDSHRYERSFTPEILLHYQQAVVSQFAKSFPPDIRIFLRYEALMPDHAVDSEVRALVESGRLGLFMTNSESRHVARVESSGARSGLKEQVFRDYCRAGKTLGYAEPFSSSDGMHLGVNRNYRQWPSAWNYWRLLGDLDCGISCVAVYARDLARATDPEYDEAFRFVARYAGWHSAPQAAPGAWIALRRPGGQLDNLTFLMREIGFAGQLVENVGPRDQRFGAWARQLGPRESVSLALDSGFAASLAGETVRVRVVYLAESADPFTISWRVAGALERHTVQPTVTGRWEETIVSVSKASLAGTGQEPDLVIESSRRLVVHLVEVRREP